MSLISYGHLEKQLRNVGRPLRRGALRGALRGAVIVLEGAMYVRDGLSRVGAALDSDEPVDERPLKEWALPASIATEIATEMATEERHEAAQTEIEYIKKKFVVQLEPELNVGNAAAMLASKRPENSRLIQIREKINEQGNKIFESRVFKIATLSDGTPYWEQLSEEDLTKERTDLTKEIARLKAAHPTDYSNFIAISQDYVGHGRNAEGKRGELNNTTLGGLTPEQLPDITAEVEKIMGATPNVISLVGCALTTTEAPEKSFAQTFVDTLLFKKKMAPYVSARSENLRVNQEGRKKHADEARKAEKIIFHRGENGTTYHYVLPLSTRLNKILALMQQLRAAPKTITTLNREQRFLLSDFFPEKTDAEIKVLLGDEVHFQMWQQQIVQLTETPDIDAYFGGLEGHEAVAEGWWSGIDRWQGELALRLVRQLSGGEKLPNQLTKAEQQLLQTFFPGEAGRPEPHLAVAIATDSARGQQCIGQLQALINTGFGPGLAGLLPHEALQKVAALEKITAAPESDAREQQQLEKIVHATPGLAAYDADTVRQFSMRLQAINALQKTLNVGGKMVTGFGGIAALCRIDQIDRELASNLLSDDIRQKRLRERRQAESELFVDLSDEVGDVMALNPQRFAERLKHLRLGLRALGNLAGPFLAAAGAFFSWKSVEETSEALKNRDITSEERNALRVQLGLGIASGIFSSILAAGSAALVLSTLSAAFGIGSGVLSGVMAGISVLGPVAGAALIGLFIAGSVHRGSQQVKEFSNYLTLSGWEKFRVGFGSLFGQVPDEIALRYGLEKLRHSVEEAQHKEQRTIFDQSAVDAIYGNPYHYQQGNSGAAALRPTARLPGSPMVLLGATAGRPAAAEAKARPMVMYIDREREIYRLPSHGTENKKNDLMEKRQTRRSESSSPLADYRHETHALFWNGREAIPLLKKKWFNSALTVQAEIDTSFAHRRKMVER